MFSISADVRQLPCFIFGTKCSYFPSSNLIILFIKQMSITIIASFLALQGADSLGTSAAYVVVVKTLIKAKITTPFKIFIITSSNILKYCCRIILKAICHKLNTKTKPHFKIFCSGAGNNFIACIHKFIKKL